MSANNRNINFVYFGGEPLGVPVLEELKASGLTPSLIVCSPDRPFGRKQTMTPPPVKVWAEGNDIDVWQPETYKGEGARAAAEAKLAPLAAEVFVVVAYNFILPQWLLDLSPNGVINVHPSLLPKLRGASPIRTAIMNDERDHIGVSVMLLDSQMDHGPILAQTHVPITDENWPVPGPELDLTLGHIGGTLLADVLPNYLAGSITPQEQDHSQATYCSRFTKADSELAIDPTNLPTGTAAQHAFYKINAFAGIGDTFFIHKGKRVKIKEAQLVNDQLRLMTIVPEGKPPQDFTTWLQAI